jgi:hypothetical protein
LRRYLGRGPAVLSARTEITMVRRLAAARTIDVMTTRGRTGVRMGLLLPARQRHEDKQMLGGEAWEKQVLLTFCRTDGTTGCDRASAQSSSDDDWRHGCRRMR